MTQQAHASKSVALPQPLGRGRMPLVLGLLGGLLAVIVVLLAVVTGFDKTSGGEVGVVRNGGPLDNNRIRQVIQPASNLTWTGLWSKVHKYPSQQRFYTLPDEVQAAVNQAQAQFAKVSEAQAKVAQAAAEAQANERRQAGYTKCPTCAQIDITKAQAEVVKSIPPNVTVYAPGNQVGLSVPQPR